MSSSLHETRKVRRCCGRGGGGEPGCSRERRENEELAPALFRRECCLLLGASSMRQLGWSREKWHFCSWMDLPLLLHNVH